MSKSSELSTTTGLYPAERTKAFIDAVIAIAMTLLILPLMEASSELGKTTPDGADWFHEHYGQIYTFLLSFVVIGFFWLAHHTLFEKVKFGSGSSLRLILLWLLSIVWLPVATALIGQASANDSFVVLVYIASMFASSLFFLFIRIDLTSHPALHTMTSDEARLGIAVSCGTVLLFLISGIIATAFQEVGYSSLLVLLLLSPGSRTHCSTPAPLDTTSRSCGGQ